MSWPLDRRIRQQAPWSVRRNFHQTRDATRDDGAAFKVEVDEEHWETIVKRREVECVTWRLPRG
jgi:hypothetical protein